QLQSFKKEFSIIVHGKDRLMRKTIPAISSILIFANMFLSGCKNEEVPAKPAAAKRAPEFTLKNYTGNPVSLSYYKGKIVVLEWFNYECPFVRYHHEQANTMTDLAKKYKNKNVVWLAINSTKHLTADKNREFARKHNIEYPIFDDSAGEVGGAYEAKTTPHMFIIDSEGMLVYDGAIDNAPFGHSSKEYVNYVDKALAELTTDEEITIPKTKPYGCTVKYAK
ncbi:MAG: redoxin domain-containing protein, partial [Planctomycetota bacterium]